MSIRIRPRPSEQVLPQCEASFDQSLFADHYITSRTKKVAAKGWDPARCNRSAAYKIGSRCLCSVHAANHLLAMVEEGIIELVGDLP